MEQLSTNQPDEACGNCGGGPQFDHQTWCGTAPGKLYAKNPEPDAAELLAELHIPKEGRSS